MKRIGKILENKNNVGKDFVIHVKNENELNELIDTLMSHDFNIQLSFDFNPEQLDLWMKDIAQEDGNDDGRYYEISSNVGNGRICINLQKATKKENIMRTNWKISEQR